MSWRRAGARTGAPELLAHLQKFNLDQNQLLKFKPGLASGVGYGREAVV